MKDQFIILVGSGKHAFSVGPFNTRLEAVAAVPHNTPPSGAAVRVVPLHQPKGN
jgi:hypothetical protein